MRIGVLDIGSNTGHLLVVDAYRGAPPLPVYSYKEPLRLAERLGKRGEVARSGVEALLAFIRQARVVADDRGCSDVMAFATSAIRDATNADDVLGQVKSDTGIDLQTLGGNDEARLTFLAVRRWFGWSSGRLVVFDIGGGSLEIAAGSDETPEIAQSMPLGAGRLTRERLANQPASAKKLQELRRLVRTTIADDAGPVLRGGTVDQAVATSKTFRSLARICGAPPSGEGDYVRRLLSADDLRSRLDQLVTLSVAEIAELPGVSANRAHQIVAGAFVADAVMDLFDLPELEICPWALREGVILERLDQL